MSVTTPEVLTTEKLSHEVLVVQLRDIPALADVSPDGLRVLAELARPRSFRPGTTVLAEGATASSLYVLLGGRVKMCRTLANGRNVVLALFEPGDLFGTVAALGGEACGAAFVVHEAAFCLELSRVALLARLEAEPRFLSEFLPVLTRQLVECRNCIVELTCYRLEARFAQLLLKLADKVGHPREDGTFIPISLSRQELADMTGTTIESCIRIMSRWGKERVVETRREGFLVRDRHALEELVHAV